MKDVVIIIGPTASGKTRFAIEMAERSGAEIISMDSMQIYQAMDIGTAKPSADELKRVKHHMINIIHPTFQYSVAEYRSDAYKCLQHIFASGCVPIVAGGTGLYLKALTNNMHLGHTAASKQVREYYEKYLQENGTIRLHEKLKTVDQKSAERLHPNDTRRIIRALEVYDVTGIPISDREPVSPISQYKFSIIGLYMNRDELVTRIDHRIGIMVKAGLADEVDQLLKMGVTEASQSMQGIGYKEFIPYIHGQVTLNAAVEQMKIRTRQYAKRQMTWFRSVKNVLWIDALDSLSESQVQRIQSFIKGGINHDYKTSI